MQSIKYEKLFYSFSYFVPEKLITFWFVNPLIKYLKLLQIKLRKQIEFRILFEWAIYIF